MKILFLDDNKERHKSFLRSKIGHEIIQAWNYDDACNALNNHVFDIAYLDHDLSDAAAAGLSSEDEKTGTDVAKFIVSMFDHKRPKQIVIHSFNPIGAKRMADIFQDYNVYCVIQPFRS